MLIFAMFRNFSYSFCDKIQNFSAKDYKHKRNAVVCKRLFTINVFAIISTTYLVERDHNNCTYLC